MGTIEGRETAVNLSRPGRQKKEQTRKFLAKIICHTIIFRNFSLREQRDNLFKGHLDCKEAQEFVSICFMLRLKVLFSYELRATSYRLRATSILALSLTGNLTRSS
ncbi:hypothetical protein B5F34_08030 [Mediterranea sp. An20]|nr:hypothetical protein B5F34_08030 [Mediterranea sp. An20]